MLCILFITPRFCTPTSNPFYFCALEFLPSTSRCQRLRGSPSDPEAKASHGLTTLCESASLVTVHTQVLCSGPSAARSGWNRSKEKKYLSCTGISVCLKSNWTFTCLYSFYWSVVLSYISVQWCCREVFHWYWRISLSFTDLDIKLPSQSIAFVLLFVFRASEILAE